MLLLFVQGPCSAQLLLLPAMDLFHHIISAFILGLPFGGVFFSSSQPTPPNHFTPNIPVGSAGHPSPLSRRAKRVEKTGRPDRFSASRPLPKYPPCPKEGQPEEKEAGITPSSTGSPLLIGGTRAKRLRGLKRKGNEGTLRRNCIVRNWARGNWEICFIYFRVLIWVFVFFPFYFRDENWEGRESCGNSSCCPPSS